MPSRKQCLKGVFVGGWLVAAVSSYALLVTHSCAVHQQGSPISFAVKPSPATPPTSPAQQSKPLSLLGSLHNSELISTSFQSDCSSYAEEKKIGQRKSIKTAR